MLKKPEERKTVLSLGGKEYCNIDIKGAKTLTSACVTLQDCMNGIAKWRHPFLHLFFQSGDGVCGLITAEEMLFLIYNENGEQKMCRIDGETFGMSKNADLEELLFVITKQMIKEVRENADAWVDNLIAHKAGYPEEKMRMKKKSFKRAMLRVIDTLEESEKEAEKQYRIPEIMKEQIMIMERSMYASKLNKK